MKLYIATAMYGGQCLVPYAKSLIESVRQLKAINIETRLDFVSNESLIQRARNLMAHKFYHSGCTHMLFVDADIGFDFQQILRLITHAAQCDDAILTGVYSKKFLNWDKIRRKLDGRLVTTEGVQTVGLDYNINVDLSHMGSINNGFASVVDAATGFMLIPRKVLEKAYAHYADTLTCKNDLLDQNHDYIAIFDCMICPISNRYLSEDFSFIRRCQTIGIPVYSDLCSKLSHTGCLTLRNDVNNIEDF